MLGDPRRRSGQVSRVRASAVVLCDDSSDDRREVNDVASPEGLQSGRVEGSVREN